MLKKKNQKNQQPKTSVEFIAIRDLPNYLRHLGRL